MIIEVVKQRPLRDLEKFAIYVDKKIDSVELKKKSGRGEFWWYLLIRAFYYLSTVLINKIATFDTDFNKVKGIKVIC